jgi:lipopolysaccharide transport system ATP-binding protein
MSDIVIRVENLSKKYILGKSGTSEGLRHVVQNFATAPLRWLKNGLAKRESAAAQNELPLNNKKAKEFWALKDISFAIKQGEVVGVIGRNGAGKSTLLKILSRITEQTEGRVEITGRVASLLEVGTGFHPELTGRENIFLNGAILGMSREEIKKKFDEIVAFAEVEKFLDTPVKRYSSGMYVRLAFAVAAHLEPEILIVDEVLAVGDVQFQKKCLGKIGEVAKSGRTVLFVSHNMQTVRQLCEKVLVLQGGRSIFLGEVHAGIKIYMGESRQNEPFQIDLETFPRTAESEGARFTKLQFLDENGRPAIQFKRSSILTVAVQFHVSQPLKKLDIPMALVHVEGQRIFSESYSDQKEKAVLEPGDYTLRFTLPLQFLKLESYFLVLGLYDSGKHCDLIEGLPMPELVDPECDPYLESRRWGVVRLPVSWDSIQNHPPGP